MIIESLVNLFLKIITFLLDKLPTIPQIPTDVSNTIYGFVDFVFENVGLLGVFVPLNLMKIIIPVWLIVEAVVTIYSITMWVIRKIPIINVS